MDKKEARRNRIFILKASFVLLAVLLAVGFLPYALFTGEAVYHPTVSGIWIGETRVTPALSVETPIMIPAAALQRIAAGEDITELINDLALPLDVEKIKKRIRKKQAAFGTFDSPFREEGTPTERVLLLFAGAHRQFVPKLDECLRKMAYLFEEDTEAVMLSQPVYTRGKIPHYNADWVYVSARFTITARDGNTKVCQIKSNCVGTVKERTGEKGNCW